MGAPQITWIVLVTIGLTSAMALHGKMFRLSFWAKLVAAGIQAGVLYWGGFFG